MEEEQCLRGTTEHHSLLLARWKKKRDRYLKHCLCVQVLSVHLNHVREHFLKGAVLIS